MFVTPELFGCLEIVLSALIAAAPAGLLCLQVLTGATSIITRSGRREQGLGCNVSIYC